MLVKWGSIIVKGSGKLGGHVFSSGLSGASVHTLSRARNPQSRNQMEVRSRFTQFTQGWRDLSESQRESWYDATSNFSRTNRFGDVVTLSGKNLYESLNTNRAILGLSVISTAPLPIDLPKSRVDQVRILANGNVMEIGGSFLPNTVFVRVATGSLSQGVKNGNEKTKIIGLGSSTNSGQFVGDIADNYSNYRAVFGEARLGSKVFVGIYSINASGQKSSISMVKAIIT